MTSSDISSINTSNDTTLQIRTQQNEDYSNYFNTHVSQPSTARSLDSSATEYRELPVEIGSPGQNSIKSKKIHFVLF